MIKKIIFLIFKLFSKKKKKDEEDNDNTNYPLW